MQFIHRREGRFVHSRDVLLPLMRLQLTTGNIVTLEHVKPADKGLV